MKNIVFFYPSFENGGASKVLVNLIKFFSKKKKIFLITNKIPKDLKKIKNLKIFLYKEKKIKFVNDRIISSLFSILILCKLVLSLNKKETLFFSMQSHFFPVLASLLLNFKLIIRVSEDPCGALKKADNILFGLIVTLSKIVTYNFADKIITNAEKSKNCVEKFLIDKKKVKILFNPTLKKIIKVNKKTKENYILNVGRLCKQKNQIMMIKAFAIFVKKNKSFKLYLCGDGPDKKDLKEIVYYLNLQKKVIFFGWKDDLSNIYKNSKLFVLTSFYEGMPNCLIESTNYEIPSIASNVSGVKDILLNGRGGVILKDYNHHTLAQKMSNVIRNYNRYKIKVKISKKKLNRFTVLNATKEYDKEFDKI